ncbi:MAG: CDP-diacylglycerol--glycerol-3-phosphate 3-phosphatidyltransferase, partial [Candidatus Parcubacteria bacterium]
MPKDPPPWKKVIDIRNWKRRSGPNKDKDAFGRPRKKPAPKSTDKPEARRVPTLRPIGSRNGAAAAAPEESSMFDSVTQIKQHPVIREAMLTIPEWISPNMVTTFRAIIMLPALAAMAHGNWWPALAVFLFSMILDFVDGALALARNQESELGKFYDPTADKVVIYGSSQPLGTTHRLFSRNVSGESNSSGALIRASNSRSSWGSQ